MEVRHWVRRITARRCGQCRTCSLVLLYLHSNAVIRSDFVPKEGQSWICKKHNCVILIVVCSTLDWIVITGSFMYARYRLYFWFENDYNCDILTTLNAGYISHSHNFSHFGFVRITFEAFECICSCH